MLVACFEEDALVMQRKTLKQSIPALSHVALTTWLVKFKLIKNFQG